MDAGSIGPEKAASDVNDPAGARLSELDVTHGFELAFGRAPESRETIEDKRRFGRADFLKVLFTSGEFLAKTHERAIAGEPIEGGLFDSAPSKALCVWAAGFCPLSAASRAKVAGATSWGGLFHALFSDPTLRTSVLAEGDPARSEAFLAALARLPVPPTPVDIRGAVESVGAHEIRGWAVDARDPDRVLEVELYLDGVFAGAAPTSGFRRDIQDAYGGEGRRGFVVRRRPGDVAEGAPVAAEVREAASGEVIGAFELRPGLAPPLDQVAAVRRELAELRAVLDRLESRLPAFNAAFGFSLDAWPEYFRTYYAPVLAAARARGTRPVVEAAVILDASGAGAPALDAALASLADQTTLPRELVVVRPGGDQALNMAQVLADWRARLPEDVALSDVDAAREGVTGGLNAAVARTTSALLLIFPAAYDLSPRAVEVLLAKLKDGAALAYADDDVAEVNGRGEAARRRDPRLRTAFDYDLLLQVDALGPLVGLRRSAMLEAGGFREDHAEAGLYDLALRLSALRGAAFAHAPEVLAHRRARPGEPDAPAPAPSARRASLADHLARVEPDARVEPHVNLLGPALEGALRVRRPARLAGARAAIIVPTRDRLDLLGPCIASLLAARAENQVAAEILVVDNQSTAAATRAFLGSFPAQSGVRVIEHDGAFNWSLMNNRAAAETEAEVLIFLNNDTVVLARDWCDELCQHALRPEVGAVGGRLLYEDGTIQHAGVVIGGVNSFAAHEGVWESGRAPGYLDRHVLVRRVMAVTGACLATRAEVFRRMGGFDHVAFPHEANDVDYCFRLQKAGLAVIYNPYATLYHLESKSRGFDIDADKQVRAARVARVLRDRWEARFDEDPFYNPHFDRLSPPLTRLRPPPSLSQL